MEQKIPICILEQLLCSSNKPSHKVCINQYCLNQALVCDDPLCQCTNKKHEQCSFQVLQPLLVEIQSKKIYISEQAKASFDFVFKIYDQMIEKLSADRCNFQQMMEMYGLKENTRDLIKYFNQNKENEITGRLIYKVKLEIQSGCNRFQALKQIKSIWSRQKDIFQATRTKLNNYSQNRFFDSVIMSLVQEKRIMHFFKNSQPIQNFKLLYRASQNQFKASLFHAKCDNINHTITVVKTKDNVVLGGYTPLKWKATEKSTCQCDPSKKTFIFCATTNQRIRFNSSKKSSIMNFKKQGPCFGTGFQCYFTIDNNCTIDNSSWTINTSTSKKYGSIHQNGLLIGTTENSVKIIDYQVFQVIWRK